MDYDFTWLESVGIDVSVGNEYTGGNDRYMSALQRFYKSYSNNSTKAKDFYNKKDWNNYTIVVHSLKSNAKMIGALSLSSSFETLEMASKENDESKISAYHSDTMNAYAKLVESLKPIGDMETVKAADEISADEAREVSAKLLEALDDFDDELSAELAKKLSGYPFRITQRERLKEATDYIEDFLYDEAAEIIQEIASTIE